MQLPQTPSFRLDGRRALVTGATSGIGLGAAVALAEAGAEVTIAARGAEKLAAVAEAMRAQGWATETLQLDAGDLETTLPAVRAAGPFDILVNNAGLARHGPMSEARIDDFDAVVRVNLRGAYFLAQEVANGLVAAGKPGAIINMSSQMGHVGGIDRSVYCATKHGVEGMTKAMAIEYGAKGVRVNTIGPTFIRTPLTESTFANPERLAWITEKIKLGRVGEVEDIMGAVVFLASDAAAMITGTHLLVDGGWTAD
jgi:NAD(P)-dependent dehydrogenase (short-subunit alcohol dehydrogenase family)